MKPIDYVIISVVALFVGGIIAYTLWKKKKDKNSGGCGCGCHGCTGCNSAGTCATHTAAEEEKDNENL